MSKSIYKVRILQCFLALTTLTAFGQNEIMEVEKPIKAQSLSGRVKIGDSPEGVKGVLVEDCTRDWKTVKDSTYTDENGHFQFADGSTERIHYLRLSFCEVHTLLIKVIISQSGDTELSLVLQFKT